MTDPTTREPDLSGETADLPVQDSSGGLQTRELPEAEVPSDPAPSGQADLNRALLALGERRRRGKLTAVLALAAAISIGFGAGTYAAETFGSTAPGIPGGVGSPPAGMLDPGALSQGATDSSTDAAAAEELATPATTVSGTVKLVDGSVIYLETEGGIVRVETDEATRTVTAAPANLADVVAGDQITVEGPQSDTALTATTITETAR